MQKAVRFFRRRQEARDRQPPCRNRKALSEFRGKARLDYLSSTKIFILSFYGAGKGSSFDIYDRNTAGNLFPPCALRFIDDVAEYSEAVVGRWCANRLDPTDDEVSQSVSQNHSSVGAENGNLFEMLDSGKYSEADNFEIGEQGVRVTRGNRSKS